MKTKTETTTQYAAFRQRRDGSWQKLHPFYARSKAEAEYYGQEFLRRACYPPFEKIKIMQRTVTITHTSTEWEDVDTDQ